MRPVSERLAVLLITLFLLLPLLLKSRSVPRREQAAFLRYTTGSVTVKLLGAGEIDGIYRFYDGATVSDVKNMTNVGVPANSSGRQWDGLRLKNGDLVEFRNMSGSNTLIALKKMTSAELMLLGVPLDPDSMSAGDWEALPGIGPSLAKEIIRDRQKYGYFRGVEGVLRVPGIGHGKINSIKKYFRGP